MPCSPRPRSCASPRARRRHQSIVDHRCFVVVQSRGEAILTWHRGAAAAVPTSPRRARLARKEADARRDSVAFFVVGLKGSGPSFSATHCPSFDRPRRVRLSPSVPRRLCPSFDLTSTCFSHGKKTPRHTIRAAALGARAARAYDRSRGRRARREEGERERERERERGAARSRDVDSMTRHDAAL